MTSAIDFFPVLGSNTIMSHSFRNNFPTSGLVSKSATFASMRLNLMIISFQSAICFAKNNLIFKCLVRSPRGPSNVTTSKMDLLSIEIIVEATSSTPKSAQKLRHPKTAVTPRIGQSTRLHN